MKSDKWRSGVMDEIVAFGKLSHRERWKQWEYMHTGWRCPECKTDYTEEGPFNSDPFRGSVIECDCGFILTHRTGGGQSDPFRWEPFYKEDKMKKAGRPPKAPEDRMTQRIYVPATAREVEQFDTEALKRDKSRQAFARSVISEFMEWKKEI